MINILNINPLNIMEYIYNISYFLLYLHGLTLLKLDKKELVVESEYFYMDISNTANKQINKPIIFTTGTNPIINSLTLLQSE